MTKQLVKIFVAADEATLSSKVSHWTVPPNAYTVTLKCEADLVTFKNLITDTNEAYAFDPDAPIFVAVLTKSA